MSTMEQIARDIREGTFPQKSFETLREEAIMEVVLDKLIKGAPGLSAAICESLARTIAMKIVASGL